VGLLFLVEEQRASRRGRKHKGKYYNINNTDQQHQQQQQQQLQQ